jgi:hypothetical protein
VDNCSGVGLSGTRASALEPAEILFVSTDAFGKCLDRSAEVTAFCDDWLTTFDPVTVYSAPASR